MTDSQGYPAATPAVSVIVPVYNAADVVSRAVASVRAQSLGDWELLLIDDGSLDASVAVIAAAADADPRIRALGFAQNRGAAAARNRGLAAARGRYIAFLDADDEWHPEKLSRQITFMQERGAAFSYTGFWRVRRSGRRRLVQVPERVDHETLLRRNVIGCLTAVYDRDALGPMPMPDFRLSHDYALWLEILERIGHAPGLDAPLGTCHRSKASLTANRVRSLMGTWQVYRQHQRMPRRRALACLFQHSLGRFAMGKPGFDIN